MIFSSKIGFFPSSRCGHGEASDVGPWPGHRGDPWRVLWLGAAAAHAYESHGPEQQRRCTEEATLGSTGMFLAFVVWNWGCWRCILLFFVILFFLSIFGVFQQVVCQSVIVLRLYHFGSAIRYLVSLHLLNGRRVGFSRLSQSQVHAPPSPSSSCHHHCLHNQYAHSMP